MVGISHKTMKLSKKISIIAGAVGVVVWASIFALFYFSDSSQGEFPEMNFGQVRGESVARFKLSSEDILIASKRGQGDYSEDILLISTCQGCDDIIIRIVRDQELLFEQRTAPNYTQASWNIDEAFFEVSSEDSEDVFWLKPAKNGYNLL